MPDIDIHDFDTVNKRTKIINSLRNRSDITKFNEIYKKNKNFCTRKVEQCSKVKDAPGICHNYYEMDKNNKINVCRTGNPCKSKVYNKFSKKGIAMNEVCTKFIKNDTDKSVVMSRRALSNSKKKSSNSSKRFSNSSRRSSYSSRRSSNYGELLKSGGKKHCKTIRKKNTYKN